MSCKVDGRSLSESRVRENFTHGLTRGLCGDKIKSATYSTVLPLIYFGPPCCECKK